MALSIANSSHSLRLRAGFAGAVAALCLAALLSFLPGQTALPPMDRDEPRYAQASKQMLETGDFVNIRFQDQARLNKPVGIYWLQAAAAAPFGGAAAPIAAYRLPSLLAAALAAGLAAWAVAPLVGRPAALLAGVMLATTPLLAVEARLAKTDAALLLATVVAAGALARLALADGGRRTARLFWAAIGAGVLLKGPIVLIAPLGAALGRGLAAGWRDDGRPWLARLRWAEGLGIVALIAGPWLALVTIESGAAFWSASVGRDLLGKVATGQESHGAPPGYHTLLLLGTFWPWSALLPLGALWLWARRREPAGGFLIGWIAAVWLVFELTATKLPHYVLPAFPALAAAAAAAALSPKASPSRPWRIAALVAFALPALALALGAAFAAPVVEGRVSWPALGLAAAAAVALGLAGAALRDGRLHDFAPRAALGAAAVYAAVFGFTLPALERGFVSPRLAEASARFRCGAEGPVALAGFREPSAVFLLGTDTLSARGAEAAALLASGRAPLAWVEAREAPGFAAEAGRLGLEAETLATVEGFNYSNGRAVSLALVAAEGQGARCGG